MIQGKKRFRLKMTALMAIALVHVFSQSPGAESVGVFFTATVPQDSFAAADVKAALEIKGFTADMQPLASLSASYANKKVVIALASNPTVTTLLTTQGGTLPTALGEQAYGLRTTTTPQMSYWVIGGDDNGAMYGGLEMAENIKYSGFTKTYNAQETPYVMKRGTKSNLALDERSPTYFGSGGDNNSRNSGDAAIKGITNVWDINYWHEWFDEMARSRFNVLAIWNVHPFPALGLPMPESYTDVKFYDGTKITMSLAQKVGFWREVMAYGKGRGFDIYFVTWNIYCSGTTHPANPSDAGTKAYMRNAVKLMFETYPNLTGIGVSAGEHMTGTIDEKAQWLAETYGNGIADYYANPANDKNRKINFLHRFLDISSTEVKAKFSMFNSLPNVHMDMSYKYSVAHMYSTPAPQWIVIKDGQNSITDLDASGMKTWLELRNEDFFFLSWGDPQFLRELIAAFPKKGADKDRYVVGYMYGSDGWTSTRDYTSKSAPFKGMLEAKREWFLHRLLGKLTFNPQTPNQVFIDEMTSRWPGVDEWSLFEAWTGASRGLPMASEMIMGADAALANGSFWWDWNWYPELCSTTGGLAKITSFSGAHPAEGSTMCSIANSASGSCAGKSRTSYFIADTIQTAAMNALQKISSLGTGAFADLALYKKNITAHSYFSLYYAEKLRGATYNKANKADSVRTAMGMAYCDWMNYKTIMKELHTGTTLQRSPASPNNNWDNYDRDILGEYTSAGGTGTPSCTSIVGFGKQEDAKKTVTGILSLTGNAIWCQLPINASYELKISTTNGRNIVDIKGIGGTSGVTKIPLGLSLPRGLCIVNLKSGKSSIVKHIFAM